MSSRGPTKQRFSTSNTAERRFEFVSSGQKNRKFAASRFRARRRRVRHVERVVAKVGQRERAENSSAIRVRRGAHPLVAGWSERLQVGKERAALVEQRIWFVA